MSGAEPSLGGVFGAILTRAQTGPGMPSLGLLEERKRTGQNALDAPGSDAEMLDEVSAG